jgi:hypothetical protein
MNHRQVAHKQIVFDKQSQKMYSLGKGLFLLSDGRTRWESFYQWFIRNRDFYESSLSGVRSLHFFIWLLERNVWNKQCWENSLDGRIMFLIKKDIEAHRRRQGGRELRMTHLWEKIFEIDREIPLTRIFFKIWPWKSGILDKMTPPLQILATPMKLTCHVYDTAKASCHILQLHCSTGLAIW